LVKWEKKRAKGDTNKKEIEPTLRSRRKSQWDRRPRQESNARTNSLLPKKRFIWGRGGRKRKKRAAKKKKKKRRKTMPCKMFYRCEGGGPASKLWAPRRKEGVKRGDEKRKKKYLEKPADTTALSRSPMPYRHVTECQ